MPASTDRAIRAETRVFMTVLLGFGWFGLVRASGSVVGAIELLVEGLGVGCGDRAGDAREHRQGDESGYEGLHGFSPKVQIYPLDHRVGFVWRANVRGS